ncbi:PDZ domain-containing protein [uncultured Proteiniphilum sp.]|uniref:PDZ domain-containing protein n=1 Tax=uncultured Proteiniphilum sp. TaxID=497637 RepID=UPI00261AE0A1|nr:PDZ domain-containing protein [uncultured Proteiniphilum sp.]
MKRIFSVIFFIIFIFTGQLPAQNSEVTCGLGFTFEISEDKSWGYKEPVIVDITPGSPAERAGLKLNDIILSVNHNGTYLKSYQTILSWFNQDPHKMNVAIRNFKHAFKEITIEKDCRHVNAITEAQLAPVFAFYSLEDVQNRRFLIPVKTTVNESALFHNYRTFAFSPSSESTRQFDERINAIFIRALAEVGLQYDPGDPDFIIQTYYNYQNNPMYKVGSPTYGSYQPVWRFDIRSNRMVKIPVYDPSEAVRVDDIAYNLEFGYRFYDRKFIEAGEMMLIWESEVKERLSSHYDLIDYLEMNLSLLLKKFPNPGNKSFGTYQVNYLKYNYTGIGYNMNDLKTVVSVDPGSPAARAGILPGDVVVNIQGQDFEHTSQSLTEGYRRFIAETMNLRDKNSRYTDSNGFKDCMFWDVGQYNAVSTAISNNRRYRSAFSYLFNFNQYIDWNAPVAINIIVQRDGNEMNFAVTPQIVTSSHILVY